MTSSILSSCPKIMAKSVVARKATEVARKRELLNFEATNAVLDEGVRTIF
jgi:hypothetical protein